MESTTAPMAQDAASTGIDARRMADICKALSHPVRVQIAAYLKKVDRCICGDIVNTLPLAQSTVSQHLKVLKSCGLVQGEIEGPKTCYCIDQKVLREFKSIVEQF